MRFRHSIAAVALFLAAAPAFAQVVTQAQCEQNRGLVRSGKIGGPAFDPSNPLPTRVISFDDFKKIKWPRGTNPKLFPSAAGQRGRVAAEEAVIYQIDNLDMVGFGTCDRGGTIEFIPFNNSILTTPIIGGWPKVKCLTGSKYANAIDEFVARGRANLNQADFLRVCMQAVSFRVHRHPGGGSHPRQKSRELLFRINHLPIISFVNSGRTLNRFPSASQ